MNSVPDYIDRAKVICSTLIDERHRHTGNCKQIVGGVLQGSAAWLAICQYDGADSYYLFGCHPPTDTLTESCHQSLENAKEQAEFEYEGVSDTWEYHDQLPNIQLKEQS